MKKITLWLLLVALIAPLARAQETAAQQQIDKLSGQIQDLTDTIAVQRQQIAALEKEINDLRDKVSTPPPVNDSASHAELKALAEQVQEVDRKRREDSDMIAKQIENLVKATAMTPPPPPRSRTTSTPPPEETADANVPSKGYEYEVKQGDTLGRIVKAYRDKGVKVSFSQIKAANPKMNPDVLIPGKKIFIPDANAK